MEFAELELRTATQGDTEFLQRLYAYTRAAELAVTPWTDEQKDAFCRQQYHAQDTYYRQVYPEAGYWVLEREGERVGRLYLERTPTLLNVIDIALLPEYCGRGIGSRIFRELQAEGKREAKRISIWVEKFNPARRLYQRLGFQEVEDRQVYLRLEWSPPPEGPLS